LHYRLGFIDLHHFARDTQFRQGFFHGCRCAWLVRDCDQKPILIFSSIGGDNSGNSKHFGRHLLLPSMELQEIILGFANLHASAG
jgi:hypothetical protein